MLDGFRLTKNQTAIVAFGIAIDGTKHILDFGLQSLENVEI